MSNALFKEIMDVNKLVQKGKFDLAFKKIQKIYDENPDNNEIKLEYGKLLLKKSIKNIEEVRSIFNSLVNTECHDDALFELSCLELNFGQSAYAEEYIKMLMQTEKRDYALLELGRLYAYRDKNIEARDVFDKATMFSKDSHLRILAGVEIGRTYISEKDYITAKWFLENLLEQVTKNDDKLIILELGKLEALLGNYDEAREYLNSLISTSTKCYALLSLGEMEIERRNFELARFYFEELKDNVLAYDRLGNIELQLGNFEKAEYLYDKKLGVRNGRLSKLGLLKLAIAKHDYSTALDYLLQIDRGNIKETDLEKYRTYLMHMLGNNNDVNNSYFHRQVKSYDKNLAITQLENHLSIDDTYLDSEFSNKIDLNKLFSDVKLSIPNLIKLRNGIFDRYIYKCDHNVANMYDKDTNLIDITTFEGTQDIVTMRPIVSEVTRYPRKTKKISIID